MGAKREPKGADTRLGRFRELAGMLKAREPSRLLWLRLLLPYVVLGKAGTFEERMERYAVVGAVARSDARLRRRYGVKLRVTEAATARLVEISYPEDGPVVSPDAVVRRRVEGPAKRLVYFHGKAKRGDVIAVERRPSGSGIRVGVLRRDPE